MATKGKRVYESDSDSQSSHKKCNGSQTERTITIDHTKQPDFKSHQKLLQGCKLDDGATDIKFIVEEVEIPAHRQVIEILKTKRQLVKEAIERDQRIAKKENTEEANIFQMSGTTAGAFIKLLEYIYTGVVKCDLNTSIQLANTAIKLKFHDLVASLAQHLEYNRQYCMNPSTVEELYHIAKCADNTKLLGVCAKYMDLKASELNMISDLRRDCRTSDPNNVLIYALSKSRYINYIHFLIPDKYEICFNVLVSSDRTNWTLVLKNEEIECRFWNWVYFEERRIKFIKIDVTDGLKPGQSVRSFKDKEFMCKRADIDLEFDKSTNYLIPKHDVIKFPIPDIRYYFDDIQPNLYTYCMSKMSKIPRSQKLKDYYYHNIGDNRFLEFYLSQTCLIDSFRIWLWDKDDRTYDFKVEVKDEIEDHYSQIKDGNSSLFLDKRSWQTIHLKNRRAVRWIRLTGVRGPPHDSEFAIVDIECPPQQKK